jgi:predicted SnoaL-like aldol condensation-catalyzing enzyme
MSSSTSNKDRAVAFLETIVAGEIGKAYAEHVAPGFRHHNPYFKGDADSLLAGMEQSEKQFPAKRFEVQRALQDGAMVAVHSRLVLDPSQPELAVVHIFRFHEGRIEEFWDIAQQAPAAIVNEHGMF